MARELDRFERRHGKGERAAEAGAATTVGLSAIEGLRHELADRKEDELGAYKRRDAFERQLQPGDILFHRRDRQDLGKFAKGDPYYHTSIYQGDGAVATAGGPDQGIRKNLSLKSKFKEDIKAYRPNVSEADRVEAARYALSQHRAPYASPREIIRHGVEHLFSPSGGPDAARAACGTDGQVCSQFVANTHPDIFKKQYASPADMRHAPEMEYIGRLNHLGDVTKEEKLLSRVAYPLAKNLKWGLGAGALAYAGMSLADHMKGNADGSP
jgi:hypothetical protein